MEATVMTNESGETHASSRPCILNGCFDEMQEPWVCEGGWVSHNTQAARQTLDKHAGACFAVNILLSALFYLFDFTTNINTLHTYYVLSYKCLRDDAYYLSSDCHLARETSLDFNWVFLASLSIIVVAHVSNSLIFWMTLPAAEHPLRFAYFLPLIHLSRLFKVMWRTCNCNRLKDFQESQEELSSLYNVLAASLETVPQLMLQLHVVMQLGIDPDQVPGPLIVSLVASVVSGVYNGSMAVLFLVQKSGMSFPWKVFIPVIAGFHTFAAIAARTMIIVALAPYEGFLYLHLIPILSYFFIGAIITWLFFGFLLHKSHHNGFSQSSHKWINRMRHAVHSFALAHVSLFIGPMYVIVKLFDEPYFFLLWGTLLHICIEILGMVTVLVDGHLIVGTYDFIPCQHKSSYINKYLTCNEVLIVVCPSLVLLLLSVVLFDVVSKRGRHEVFINEVGHHEAEMVDKELMISDEVFINEVGHHEAEMVDKELMISDEVEEFASGASPFLPSCRQPTSFVASNSNFYISVIMVLFVKKLSRKKRKSR